MEAKERRGKREGGGETVMIAGRAERIKRQRVRVMRQTGRGRGQGRTLVAIQMQVGESAEARGIRESEDQRYGPFISDRVEVEVECRKFRASV